MAHMLRHHPNPSTPGCERLPVAEQVRSPWMGSQPLPQRFGKERRKRNTPGRSFSSGSLLFLDQYGLTREINVSDLNPEQFAVPGSGMGGKAHHGKDPRKCARRADVIEKFRHFVERQEERAPEIFDLPG